tara:strand:- start:15599 stop:16957 length:1359 start_codon:yes stop_codon:yes gene_type:complete
MDLKSKKIYKLDNGIRVLLLPLDDTKLVNIKLSILLGQNHETNKTHGITHYIEHLMAHFTSKKYKNYKIIKEKLSKVGASSNASVSDYKFNIYIYGLYSNIEMFMDILSNTFKDFYIDDNIFSQEKEAVINEVTNKYIKTDSYIFYQKMNKYLYKKNYKIYDYCEDIKLINSFDKKKIYKFFYEYFIFKNMVLTISFNKKYTKHINNLVKKYFNFKDKNKKKNIRKIQYPLLFKKNNKLRIINIFNKNINLYNNSEIVFTYYDDIKIYSKRWCVLHYISKLLSNFEGPLMDKMRTELGLVYTINLHIDIDEYNSKNTKCTIYSSCIETKLPLFITNLLLLIDNLSKKDLKNFKNIYNKKLININEINKNSIFSWQQYENNLLYKQNIINNKKILNIFKNITINDLNKELIILKKNFLNKGMLFYYSNKNYNKIIKENKNSKIFKNAKYSFIK